MEQTYYPTAPEAEAYLIGAMLTDPDAATIVFSRLKVDDFVEHRTLAQVLWRLHERGAPLDIPAVVEELNARGLLDSVGGVSAVTDLAAAVPSTANLDYYIRKVQEAATVRRLAQHHEAQLKRIAERGYESAEELIAATEAAMIEARPVDMAGRGLRPVKSRFDQYLEMLDQRAQNRGVQGLPTGFTDLDRMLCGLRGGDLIVIAARPSVGKTAFALNIALNIMRHMREKRVGIFSQEMRDLDLIDRMVAFLANVELQRLRTGDLEEEHWERVTQALSLFDDSLMVDDSSSITLEYFIAECRRAKKMAGLDLVIVDYLQLMNARQRRDETEAQAVGRLSRGLKWLARELDIPVIALSQLNREVERRSDKRPTMADIRSSGQIEQDADVILLLHRDDYYDPDTDRKNIVEVIVAKQRNGPTGTVELVFLKEYNIFANLERYREE